MSIDVYTAKNIITMNPSWPSATAVAVRDGVILEAGSLQSLEPWLAREPHALHDFGEAVMLPGLIDPHLHPMMAAVLLPMNFVTAFRWELPWQAVPASDNPQTYQARLRELFAASPADEPFFSWGYHAAWHGEMNRALMDDISGDRPMVIWHRSFHEVYLNTAMMRELGITEQSVGARQQIDLENGRFYEVGLGYAIQKLNRIIMSEAWIGKGLDRLKQVVHAGGHTTVGDMAVGIFDYERERQLAQDVLDQSDVPFRVLSVPHAVATAHRLGGHDKVLSHLETLYGTDTKRRRYGRHIKLFTDGAFFSELAMLGEPGYIDGHHGEWLMTPEEFMAIIRTYWYEDYAIHVHCTGDLGLELAIDGLSAMQREKPRFEHGFTIEHFGFSTPEQVKRISDLGGYISANVYYLYELSERYATHSVGFERAYTMSRLGTAVRHGIPTAIHSDFPMAPATPLQNAYVAASRMNAAGKVAGEQEALSVAAALRSITTDAAMMLGLQHEVGSIAAGKQADFTVIDRDPIAEGATALRDAKVLATVFSGEVFAREN